MTQKPSLIYFIKPVGLDGPIKIGCSTYADKRLLGLASWSPFPLELIGSVPGNLKDEFFIHQCFADLHSHHEWFHAQPRLIHAIKTAVEAGSLDNFRGLERRGTIRASRRGKMPQGQRRLISYSSRVRIAENKLRKQGIEAWKSPEDIWDILNSARSEARLSSTEIARLDEYLSDPTAHSCIPPWKNERGLNWLHNGLTIVAKLQSEGGDV